MSGDERIARVLRAFGVGGRVIATERLGGGHIHRTHAVTIDGHPPIVVQELNGRVFRNLDACEENLRRIDDHFRSYEPAPPITVPRHLRVHDGRIHATLDDGSTWRATERLTNVTAPVSINDAGEAHTVASAFGIYATILETLPGAPLHATIPRFHDFAWRVAQLDDAVTRDAHQRRQQCAADLSQAAELARLVGSAAEAKEQCRPRVVHNDAKVTNVLCALDTGLPIAVVDLDTTMPGSPLTDLGELIRSAATTQAEDSDDLDAVEVRHEIVSALTDGFLTTLTGEVDRDLVPFAGPILAVENGIRFLTDHLSGDVYFAISRPGQNLARARMQFRLADLLLAGRGR